MKNIKNLKITKKILALVAAGTLVLTCSGCISKETNLLEGTILENTQVITFEDGHKDIATISTWCNENYDVDKTVHDVYKSVVSGEYFSDDECTVVKTLASQVGSTEKINKYQILKSESIVSYLTPEEIVKANNSGLTNEDIDVILTRVFGTENQVQATK